MANDIILEYDKNDNFKKGFVPEEGQKIYAKCDGCGTLYEVLLGQGNVCLNNECTKCGYDFGDGFVTYHIFETVDVYFVYSDIKYVEPFMDKGRTDLNHNIPLTINVSKVLGETFFEEIWGIYEKGFTPIKEFLEKYPEDFILINKNDEQMYLYLKFYDIPLDRIYIIDEDQNVSRLYKINISINIE
jgi:PHP family Zn ribbon phosphoesterase